MKIAIIGGAGFVGTRLAKLFDLNQIEYYIFDKVLSDESYIDITIPKTFEVLDKFEIDAVVNLAAEHRDDVSPKSLYDDVNVQGSKNICEYCSQANIQNIIFTSSVAVYGFSKSAVDENGEIKFFNDYGRTKYLAENVYRDWYDVDKSLRNLTIIRPTVIFGEANRGNVYNLLNQIYQKRFIMFGKGRNIKSMAYVENVVEFIAYSTQMKGYNLYNYIDKPDLNMNSLISYSRNVLFKKNNVGIRMPGWLGIIIGYMFDLVALLLNKKLPISSIRVKKFMSTTLFNTSIDKTGYKPKVTLEEGLYKTLKYEFLEDNSSQKTYQTE
ncbi:NAD-dependent epimerase/dehydratase family protein [Gammaproteobacteria bacterium]|nr:NAD-dependent epimerase/dehydratase family protein [Gammaproteobacteria bacterium]